MAGLTICLLCFHINFFYVLVTILVICRNNRRREFPFRIIKLTNLWTSLGSFMRSILSLLQGLRWLQLHGGQVVPRRRRGPLDRPRRWRRRPPSLRRDLGFEQSSGTQMLLWHHLLKLVPIFFSPSPRGRAPWKKHSPVTQAAGVRTQIRPKIFSLPILYPLSPPHTLSLSQCLLSHSPAC